MRIEKLFKKDIRRSINGVVKADELDDGSVWQDLEEFVVTKELDGHLRTFFTRHCESLDAGDDPGKCWKDRHLDLRLLRLK